MNIRIERMMSDYWRQNRVADGPLRRQAGLEEHRPDLAEDESAHLCYDLWAQMR